MKNVLLTLENPSDFFIDSCKELTGGNPPFAILLLEKTISEVYTIQPSPQQIVEREKNKTIAAYDRVPHTHYQYYQPCIIYFTKDELENDNGTYFDCLPEEVMDDLYEYRARLV